MFSGGIYCVTPQKKDTPRPGLRALEMIRDVRRRSIRVKRTMGAWNEDSQSGIWRRQYYVLITVIWIPGTGTQFPGPAEFINDHLASCVNNLSSWTHDMPVVTSWKIFEKLIVRPPPLPATFNSDQKCYYHAYNTVWSVFIGTSY